MNGPTSRRGNILGALASFSTGCLHSFLRDLWHRPGTSTKLYGNKEGIPDVHQTLRQTDLKLLGLSIQKRGRFYGKQIMETAYNMIAGLHIGMIKACMKSYDLTDIMERFKNVSFTFSQFLHHVDWTHDHNMVNVHWMAYTESCDPCRRKMDYTLQQKTIQVDDNHLFHGVLGYSKKVRFYTGAAPQLQPFTRPLRQPVLHEREPQVDGARIGYLYARLQTLDTSTTCTSAGD